MKFYYRERLTVIIDQFSVIEAATPEAAEEQFEEGLGKHLGHSILKEIDHDGVTTEMTTEAPPSIEFDSGPDRVVVFTEGGIVTHVEGNAPLQYQVVDFDELSDTGDATEQEAVDAARKWLVEAPARMWPPERDGLLQALTQAIEESGFAVSGPTDSRAAEHGEPVWVSIARGAIAEYSTPAAPPEGPKSVWACPDCKSTHVQSQMWVRTNTNEVLDDTERYSWCDACDADGHDGEKDLLIQILVEETREQIEAAAAAPQQSETEK